jgi:hypothetical protein
MQALSSLVAVAAAIDRAQFLGGHPRGGDLATLVTGLDPGQQPPPGGGGQVLGPAAQHPADAIQWVAAAAAMAIGGCCTPRRTSSTQANPSRTTWNGSSTRTALGNPADSAAP